MDASETPALRGPPDGDGESVPRAILERLSTDGFVTEVPFDLSDRDWVLSDQLNGGEPVPTAGRTQVAILVESLDDAAFDVLVRSQDATGTTKVEIDSSMDGDLSSTSPTGGNAFVFVTVAVPGPWVDVAITDTSGGQNRIDATIHVH